MTPPLTPPARPATPVARRCGAATALVVAVAVAALVAGCTSGGGSAAPTTTTAPTSTVPVPTVTVPDGFVLADTRGVPLAPFRGRAPAEPGVPVRGGTATITGLVRGPDGPVPGAIVQLERFLGDRVGTAQVQAGPDGRFRAGDLLGGRYRVRAWLAPTLAAVEAVTAFLPADRGTADVELVAQRFDQLNFQADVDVAGLVVGEVARVRGLLTRQAVDANGIVVGEPQPSVEVRLDLGAGLTLAGGGNPGRTDAAGFVSWPVRCTQPGGWTAVLTSAVATASAAVPGCVPVPTTTVPPPTSAPTTTVPGPSTTSPPRPR